MLGLNLGTQQLKSAAHQTGMVSGVTVIPPSQVAGYT